MQKLSLESKKDGSSAAKKVALWAVLGGFCFVKIFLVEGGDSLIIILIRTNHAFLICTIVAFWVAIYGSTNSTDAQSAASQVDRSITPLLQEAMDPNFFYQPSGYASPAYYYPSGT